MRAPRATNMPAKPRQIAGLCDLAEDYDVILCDVWGVIHNGVAHFPKAVEALARFRAKGGRVVLVTNAPRPKGKILEFLEKLGVSPAAFDALVSSGDVTVSLILARQGQSLCHIGPEQDHSLFAAAEASGGAPLRFAALDAADFVICTGFFDAERETPEDYAGRLDLMHRRGLDFICANPDLVVEVGGRLVYCAGALAEAYEARGGHVIQAGKPYAPIYARAIGEAARVAGKSIERRRVLAIGDAMHTDMAGAQAQSLDSLFVTSGIHRAELHGNARASQLDAAAFHQFIENAGFAPSAAIPELVW